MRKKQRWVSMAVLSREIDVSIQTINNWAARGNIKSKFDPSIGMKLVDAESIDIKTMEKKDGVWVVKKMNEMNLLSIIK